MSIFDILKQYVNPGPDQSATSQAHFDQIGPQVSPDVLGQGVSATMRSSQTPAFGDMVGDLFGRSNPQQRAGVLNQIISSVGPSLSAGLGGGALARIVGGATNSHVSGGLASGITPDQASQLSPEQVRDIAAHAEQHNPGIVDQVGSFYGQHPDLIRGIGGMALAVLLGKMASH
jgi:hypothetical protein